MVGYRHDSDYRSGVNSDDGAGADHRQPPVWPVDRLAGDYRAGRHDLDFGIANSIIQRKTIGHLELTTLYWLNVGLGIVVFAVVFWLSDAIAHVLHNPDLAPLIKTLSLAFIVIPHGQQFRALMQKELEFNKIGMIETTSVLAGFTFTVISAHYWPLALTAILGYLVNSAVRTLLFGYFTARFTVRGCIFRWHRCPRTCVLARG